MSDKNVDQSKITATGSTSWKLWTEWKIFLRGFLRAPVIIPLAFTVVALFLANKESADRTLSLVLQIIAALLVAISGKFFYDVIRNVFEGNILIKKGLSAVRNLALARIKTNNISDRAKANASTEEIRNLLSLLEKDIANATQEWNDILPGVNKLEEVYTLLAEKEAELAHREKEKEQLTKQFKEEKELSGKEKEDLKKVLAEKERKISDLSYEISSLRLKTEPLIVASGTFAGGTSFPDIFNAPIFGSSSVLKQCKECGSWFSSPCGFGELCNDCLSKSEKK